jgi:hypothetical protein
MSDKEHDWIKEAVDANIPQLGGCIAAYWTFRDKPYAVSLAREQLTHSLGERVLVAIGWSWLEESVLGN